MNSVHVYEIRPRKDNRGVDLICDRLPSGRLWYRKPNAVGNAIGYAKHYSRAERAIIRIYDAHGALAEMHDHAGNFKEP
jgi:hypothetical protein